MDKTGTMLHKFYILHRVNFVRCNGSTKL